MSQLALFADPAPVGRYFQTTPLTPQEARSARESAGRQDRAVLAIFRERKRPLTPSEVWRLGCDQGMRWPLTSARRAMTNLTDAGLLAETGCHQNGPYGRPEGLWTLA